MRASLPYPPGRTVVRTQGGHRAIAAPDGNTLGVAEAPDAKLGETVTAGTVLVLTRTVRGGSDGDWIAPFFVLSTPVRRQTAPTEHRQRRTRE